MPTAALTKSTKETPVVTKRLEAASGVRAQARLTLPYGRRRNSRQRAFLDDGAEVWIMLPRGTVMRPGDLLEAENGLIIEVAAEPESLSLAETSDPLLLATGCYHLGNRHVPVQIESGRLFYQHDHVLDDMVIGLGLKVTHANAPFQPEDGAYSGGGGYHHHHG